MRSQRVGHDLVTEHTYVYIYTYVYHITLALYIYVCINIYIYIYVTFFIHLFIDEHLVSYTQTTHIHTHKQIPWNTIHPSKREFLLFVTTNGWTGRILF